MRIGICFGRFKEELEIDKFKERNYYVVRANLMHCSLEGLSEVSSRRSYIYKIFDAR